MKAKIAIFTTLLLGMLFYIGWIFYMSEPKYIDNAKEGRQNEIEKYDVVSTQDGYGNTNLGIVIQIDSNYKNGTITKAIVRNFENVYHWDKLTTINLKKYVDSATHEPGFVQLDYRIVGKGTFYHKVNSFVGFNIMLITTLVIAILAIVVLITLIGLIREFMGWSY